MTDGRPKTSEEQFQKWLEDMTPFLKLGETLHASIWDAGLEPHDRTIREKYKLNDWFSRKIDAFREYPGKEANNVLARFVFNAAEKQKQGIPVSEDEMRNVRMFAEKSRSAQPYFVNRQENAEGKSVAEILHELETPDTVDDVVENIEKDDVGPTTNEQVVAPNPPVQNQEQTGSVS